MSAKTILSCGHLANLEPITEERNECERCHQTARVVYRCACWPEEETHNANCRVGQVQIREVQDELEAHA